MRVLKAGHAFGETTDLLPVSFVVPRAKIEPGVYRNITGNTALAWGIVAAAVPGETPGLPRRLPDNAGERRAARGRPLPTLRREDFPGRRRDRRDQRGDRRILRRGAGGVHHERSRHGAQAGSAGTGRDGRAPARRDRRPARRALHRNAHQDRAGRPADGALRAQLRQPGPGAGASDPGRLLLYRARGLLARDRPHDARDRALGLLPGEQRRALADSRRGGAAAPRRLASPVRPRTSSPTRATRRRSRGPGRFRARRASSIGSAGSRRRTSPATCRTTRETTRRW